MAEVKIYWGTFDAKTLNKDNVSRLNNSIPKDYQLNLQEAKKTAQVSFFAKLMLNEILETEYELKDPLSTFNKDEYGKPSIQHKNLHFNISHSNDIIGIAISEVSNIGFDLQAHKSFNPKIIHRVFTEPEHQGHKEATDKSSFFFDTWSRKEASVKATGKGIKTGLSTFSVLQNVIELENQELHLENLKIIDGFSAAIAVNHPISNVVIKKLL